MYEIYFKSLAPKLTAILRYEEDVFKIYFMIEAYKVFVFLRKEIETWNHQGLFYTSKKK